MSARCVAWSLAALIALGVWLGEPMLAQVREPSTRALLSTYCSSCHNERTRSGGLTVAALNPDRVADDTGHWEAVARRLREGTMPPAGHPRPDAEATRGFVADIEARLDRAAQRSPRPGRPALHRLNRVEYTNAIRDLFALDIQPETVLPADTSLDGFDNVAGILSMSPALMERYLMAARRISRLAVGDPSIGPAFASATYSTAQDVWQSERMSDEMPFGSQGGVSIHHGFPLDGEYVCRIRLRRSVLGYVRGLEEPHALEVTVDGRRVAAFTVGGESHGNPAPQSFAGVIPGDPAWEAYAVSADDGLRVRFHVGAGAHTVAVFFAEERYEEEGVRQPPTFGLGFSFDESRAAPTEPRMPAVDSVSLDGPYEPGGAGETPSRSRIFRCRPTSADAAESCASEILSSIATRAYRRPVTGADLQVLLTFYRMGLQQRDFEEGIRFAIERLLIDPNFLFRAEQQPKPGASAAVPISDLDLASRLSFFLWSSIPDDELRDTAVAGSLHDPKVLAAQVSRMSADARSSALVDNFAVQWLSLRRLREVLPDPELFEEFDGNLRNAFEEETRRFVASQIREDRSVLDLITSDYSYLNERLARHYGIPGVYGSHFRRVTVPERRRGLLGQGSILTLTSYPTRTSPVLRGRWLLDTVFGSPPPPPPPDVPSLPSSGGAEGVPRSVRERTERHRANPTCAGCHQRMDPLGFLLENFDAIGRWRPVDESGRPVDASGAFTDGTTWAGIEGLRAMILAEPEAFVRTVSAKLLAYALGRALEPYDAPAIRRIARDAAAGGYRWSAIVSGVVNSVPFQMRGTEP